MKCDYSDREKEKKKNPVKAVQPLCSSKHTGRMKWDVSADFKNKWSKGK